MSESAMPARGHGNLALNDDARDAARSPSPPRLSGSAPCAAEWLPATARAVVEGGTLAIWTNFLGRKPILDVAAEAE